MLLNAGTRAPAASPGLLTTVAWGLADRTDYALEASIFVTGAAVQWLREKHKGLAVSKAIPEEIPGLYHAGSVGIIMSGWLGAINYGVIVANEVDSYLSRKNAV